VQEEDVLDTWFSSALWPFSTLGWPDKTKELETHYPTDVLVTDRGIIYFWVARMIFSGLKFLDKPPFHTVYIHGTILDEKGQRMSKSKGNGIDPIEMIDQYGADAVRFALMILTTEGQDIKLSPVKFETGRNFANKLWNAVRFVLPHVAGNREPLRKDTLHIADRWILGRLDATIRKVTEALEPRNGDAPGLRFSEAATALYQFTWDDFCSNYLEIRKKVITAETASPEKRQAVSVFTAVLEKLIGLLHPFMPFITEEIHSALELPGMQIEAKWPEPGNFEDTGAEAVMETLLRIVDAARAIRGDYAIPPAQALDLRIACDDDATAQRIEAHKDVITSLDRIGSLIASVGVAKPPFSASALFRGGRLFVPLQGILDPAKEKERLTKELGKAEGFAAAQEKKLANDNFVKGAPPEVVEGERQKLQSQHDRIAKLKEGLADLG
jgi:valyl-tRNA synthetase